MPDVFEKQVPSAEMPPTAPEVAHTPEQPRPVEKETPRAERSTGETAAASPPAVPQAPVGAPKPLPVDPVLASVERILSEDLYDLYRSLPPDAQARFMKKGEETTIKIRALMGRATVKAKEILGLIIDWLKLIPGINKYFLEQESKIKTDKLLELHKRERGETL